MEIRKYKEIGKIRSGKRLPKGFSVSPFKTKNKYIRIRDLNKNEINIKDVQYITDEASSYIQKYTVNTGDIIISVVGTVGAIAEIPKELDGAYLTENCNKLLVNENICKKKYLKYFLQSSYGQNEIASNIVGSTQPKLPIYGIENFNIPLPNIFCQNKIIRILDIIDKKVQENNATNNNLYELSKTVYKDWYEKLDKSKKSIFCEFKELGTPVMGQSPKGESYNYENNGYPLINGAADYKNGYLSPQKYTSMPTKICHNGDYIFCIRATIGLLVESDRDYCLGRGVAGITSINPLYKEYVYHLIESSIDKFKNMATGSVIVGISKDDIRNMEVVVPSNEEIKQFHIVQKELFSKMKNIREENETLIKLRDTLLPKLMNGEIDLENIEI